MDGIETLLLRASDVQAIRKENRTLKNHVTSETYNKENSSLNIWFLLDQSYIEGEVEVHC